MVPPTEYVHMVSESGGGIHPQEDYLEAVEANEPASTRAVAESVGVTRQGADYRLRRLEEAGKVESTKIGGSLAWSLATGDGTNE